MVTSLIAHLSPPSAQCLFIIHTSSFFSQYPSLTSQLSVLSTFSSFILHHSFLSTHLSPPNSQCSVHFHHSYFIILLSLPISHLPVLSAFSSFILHHSSLSTHISPPGAQCSLLLPKLTVSISHSSCC